MKLEDTRVHIGGLYRCCLMEIGSDCPPELKIGMKSNCEHCGRTFVLRDKQGKEEHPHWEPMEKH